MFDVDFLEPERLRAFVTVAELGSFSRAAERLRLAQPTISIQVRRLEETVGRLLLERKSSSVRPTKDGEAMLAYAKELLAVSARARLQFDQPPLEGSLRLGVVEDFNYTPLSEILRSLRTRHPRFELVIRSATSAELQERLRSNDLDVVLAKRRAGSTEGELICRQKMAWIGQASVLRQDDVVPLVLTPPDTFTRDIIFQALRAAGRRWSVRFEAPTLTGLNAAVLAGLGVTAFGVGVIPSELVPLSKSLGLPKLAEAEFTMSMTAASDDPVIATFVDLMRRIAPLIVGRLEDEQSDALT